MRQPITATVLYRDDTNQRLRVRFDDHDYALRLWPYLRRDPLPAEVPCLYESDDAEGRRLTWDLRTLMSGFYKRGDTVVLRLEHRTPTYLDLRTREGFFARLSTEDLPDITATHLECRVARVGQKYIEVAFVAPATGIERRIPFADADLCAWLGEDRAWNTPALREAIMSDIDDDNFLSDSRACLRQHFDALPLDERLLELTDMREALTRLAEGPDLLPRCTELRVRRKMEERLTTLILQLECRTEATRLQREGDDEAYVERTLTALNEGAYLVHAEMRMPLLCAVVEARPELIARHIDACIRAVRRQRLEVWLRDPYARCLMRLFQLYVRHIYPQNERLTTDAEARSQLIRALAAELTLEHEARTALIDFNLHKAILLRLCSEMKVCEADAMLEKAIATLFDADLEPALPRLPIDDADYIANLLGNTPLAAQLPQDPMQYDTGSLTLEVSERDITISRTAARHAATVRPLDKAQLWHQMGVLTESKPAAMRTGSVSECKQTWADIRLDLQGQANPTTRHFAKTTFDVDDPVYLIATGMTGQRDDLALTCQVIDDQDGRQGTGTLRLTPDIVAYKTTDRAGNWPGLDCFLDPTGRPYVLYARVKAVLEDGTYTFTMTDDVNEAAQRYFDEHQGQDVTCRVNQRKSGLYFPSVAVDGFSLLVADMEDEDFRDLGYNQLAVVRLTYCGGGRMMASFVRPVSTEEDRPFSHLEGLRRLVRTAFHGDVYEAPTADGEEQQAEPINAGHVEELLNILDAKAEHEDDYTRLYHYLSLARLLAEMLGDTARQQYYAQRQELLVQMDFFNTNDRVDAEALALLAGDDFEHSPKLRHDYQQLRTMACLGDEDSNTQLSLWCQAGEDPELQHLAALVLAHNIMKKSGMLTEATAIREKIRTQLRLRSTDTKKKQYGREDLHTEFKTTMVYPPEAMHANLEEQTNNILRVICGMLNADGGTLYLGVNDMGYETGLAEDLRHERFNGSRDRYTLHLHNNVAHHLGQGADHCVTTTWDEEVEARVLIVRVERSPRPVPFMGHYYERMGSSTRLVSDEYLPDFLGNASRWTTTVIEATRATTDAPLPTSPLRVTEATAEAIHGPSADDLYDGRPAVAYLTFLGDHEYVVSDNAYRHQGQLTLPIHDEETEPYLLLLYATGCAARVSVHELLEKDRDRRYKYNNTQQLLFATLADTQDYLFQVLVDKRGNRYYRANRPSDIPEDNMQATGAPLTTTQYDRILYANLLAATARTSLKRDQKLKDIGTPVNPKTQQAIVKLFPAYREW